MSEHIPDRLIEMGLHHMEEMKNDEENFDITKSEMMSLLKSFEMILQRVRALETANDLLHMENQELEKRYAERMNDCIRLKTQLSNRRKFKSL